MERVREAIDLIKDRVTPEQLQTINILDLAEEFNYMDYNDWEEYYNNGLEKYMCEILGLEDKPKREWVVKKTNCPKCDKTLIRLEPYKDGVSKFWCDDCNINITYKIG